MVGSIEISSHGNTSIEDNLLRRSGCGGIRSSTSPRNAVEVPLGTPLAESVIPSSLGTPLRSPSTGASAGIGKSSSAGILYAH